MFEDLPKRTIAETIMNEYDAIRTVWIGIYEPIDGMDIFGTAYINEGSEVAYHIRGYHTKEEALAGHREIVANFPHSVSMVPKLSSGVDPEEVANSGYCASCGIYHGPPLHYDSSIGPHD